MQFATCNLQHAICNMQFATCNLQHSICNMQFATCNFPNAICMMQFAWFNIHECGTLLVTDFWPPLPPPPLVKFVHLEAALLLVSCWEDISWLNCTHGWWRCLSPKKGWFAFPTVQRRLCQTAAMDLTVQIAGEVLGELLIRGRWWPFFGDGCLWPYGGEVLCP